MKECTYKLGGAADCRDAIEAASNGDPISIEQAVGGLHFLDRRGRIVGILTARHELAKALAGGAKLLHCSANSVYGRDDMRPDGAIHIRVAIGEETETYQQRVAPEPRPPRAYPVNVVGESLYQAAIALCSPGERVELFHESDNPHDDRALVVKTCSGAVIGYIASQHWLQRVVHEDGCGVSASILVLHPGPPIAVVIEATVSSEPLALGRYQPRAETFQPGERPVRDGWIERLLP